MRKVQFFPNGGTPLRAEKVDRNAPCPCGSGKKAKMCCGTEVKYFHRVRKPDENKPIDKLG